MPETNHSSETILLAVTGMSPAVLTETVWALAQESPPIIPDRVIAVCTASGRERIISDLLTENGPCVWSDLRDSLESVGHDVAGKLRFGATADDIRVITSTDPSTSRSYELEDLSDQKENEAAANFLLDQVRTITANPDTLLIASLAGGRKTLSALLYGCMTLSGRQGDRLTHVLVSAPHESTPSFFFPGQKNAPEIKSGSNNKSDPSSAIVKLIDVPFVPLRNLFEKELGRNVGSFSNLVDTCSNELRHRAAEELQIEIYCHRSALCLNQQDIQLSAREHHLMLCLAELAKNNKPAVPSYGEALDKLAAHAKEWQKLIDLGKLKQGTPAAAVFGDEQDIRRVLSDLRKKLKALGPFGSSLANALPERGRFSLDIPGDHIQIS